MRILLTFLLFSFCLTALTLEAVAQQTTAAKQALIIDYETGQTLLAKNDKQHMPTSSMSKVMTAYMVFDALKKGTVKLDSEFRVSEKAWKKGGSKMFVEVGKKISVEDLLRGIIIQSGNDATIVIAEGLAGNEAAFAKNMTRKAKEIGMKDSNFVNASGWPDPNHYSSAQDLVTLAKAMIEDFPQYYGFYGEKEFSYNNIKQANRNPLLYRNIGADGLKTGHTEIAGYGLIGTAKQDNRRVIMVVNGLESEKARADESVRLIEWALNNFVNIDLAKADKEITKAPVTMGKADQVTLKLTKDIKLTIPKAERDNFTVDIAYNTPLIAPLLQNQEVGKLIVKIDGMPSKKYPLVTAEAVEKLGLFKGTWAKIKLFIKQAL